MSNYNVIAIDMGHPLKCGAFGYVSETDKNREIGKELIKILEDEGKKIVNCTIDTRYSDDLARRVNIANKAKVDLYVSIHLDSFSDPSANGVTVFTTTTSGAKEVAKRVVNNVASSCGYKNRGLKYKNLYVIRNTIAPAFLIECGFVTNKEDCNRFNAYEIAKAIAEGILDKKIDDPNREPVETYGASNQWCLFTWGFDRNESISSISKIDLNIPLYFVPYENGNKIWLNTGYVTKEEAEKLWKKFADVNAKPQKLVSKEEWDWKVDRGLIF